MYLFLEFNVEKIAEIWKRDVTWMPVTGKVSQELMGAFSFSRISFRPLGATAQGELRPPEQSASFLPVLHPSIRA